MKDIEQKIKEIEQKVYNLIKQINNMKEKLSIGRIEKKIHFDEQVNLIIKEIYDIYGIDIKKVSRIRSVVAYRNCFIHIIYNNYNISLKELGSYLGKHEHSTLIHSKATVDKFMSINDEYYKEVYMNVLEIKNRHLLDINQEIQDIDKIID
jgi:chromosomal replication initiation ATPase DnaA